MKRSKLQATLAILNTLWKNGRSKPTHITYHTFQNITSANECLSFLREHELVQEIEINKRTEYEITSTGIRAIRLAHRIDECLPLLSCF